jgi:hypothetical protein
MVTLIFGLLLILICGKLLWFAIKAAWGLSKIIVSVVLFPVLLIGMVCMGLIYLAFPILVIVGVVALIKAWSNE